MRISICSLTLMLLLAVLAPPILAEGPAVSRVNAKFEGFGGNVDSDSVKAAAFSLTLPLGVRCGAQLDVAYGEIGDDDVKGSGLHLFTRDPEHYLLGIDGVYAELEQFSIERYAVEGELYIGPFTLAAMFGRQGGDVDNAVFGNTAIRWYPLEDLGLASGVSFADNGNNKAHFEAEYQIAGGVTVFADIASGEHGYDHALLGARYYLGTDKTLIERAREDDPQNNVLSSAIEALIYFKEVSRKKTPDEPTEVPCETTQREVFWEIVPPPDPGWTCVETVRQVIDCNGVVISSEVVNTQCVEPF